MEKEVYLILILFTFTIFWGKYSKYKVLEIVIAIIIIFINIIIIYSIYKNNITLGYPDGIMYGNYWGVNIYDDYRYFNESYILYSHWENGEFLSWIKGELPNIEFYVNGIPGYGNYNIFVIMLAFARIIGIETIVQLNLFKLLFTVISIYFFIDIAKIYIRGIRIYLATLLVFLFPTTLVISSTLLRDNIILMLVLYLFLNYIIRSKKVSIFKFLIPILFLFALRFYLGIILVLILAIKKYIDKNYKIKLKDMNIIIFMLIGLLMLQLLASKFMYINLFYNNINNSFGIGMLGIIKLIVKSIITIFIPVINIEYLSNPSLYIKLIWISHIIYLIISSLFLIKFIFIWIKGEKEINKLVKNGLIFSFILSIVMLGKDGFLESRITIMWSWIFIITIFNTSNKRNDECDKCNNTKLQ